MIRKLQYFFALLLLVGVVQVNAAEEDSADREKIIGEGSISSDVFGSRGGYAHPFLTVSKFYSDNIYNTDDNTESDYISTISPGIWLALPRVKEELLDFETSSVASGGLDLDLDTGKDFKRYQIYFYYSPEFYMYSDNSDEDLTKQRAEGMLQYNLRGGLTLEFVDQYIKSMDVRGTGISTEQDKFSTNFFMFRASYDIGPKLEFMADFSNFNVNYDASQNDYRDREDDSWSAYVWYELGASTSIFAQYQNVDVSYDLNSYYDSSMDRFYGGLSWDMTAKSSGTVKVGSSSKDYDNSLLSDVDDVIVELQLDYIFSSKTDFELRAFRQNSESNIAGVNSILRSLFNAKVTYKPIDRITCILDLEYVEDDYDGALNYGGFLKERKDSSYLLSPSVEYRFKEWLTAKAAYYYIERDSNFSDFDYSTNTFLISLTAAL
ncbi:MAG: outer membrane beta-barrel protein [Desulfobulbaceae bacterium]|uniref:Outer membrane beta-barrel protein n=1 Tax=Candidatus Desulfobia pelagia TaxID=2841692 RepID=A0A8J6ND62_9BACT|nr:outer membrane beta-barrel protein [Candidatus Desulfobia pelagia]